MPRNKNEGNTVSIASRTKHVQIPEEPKQVGVYLLSSII